MEVWIDIFFGFWKQVIFRFHTVDGWNPAPPGMYETL